MAGRTFTRAILILDSNETPFHRRGPRLPPKSPKLKAPKAIVYQPSAISHQPSAISYQLSAISHQPCELVANRAFLSSTHSQENILHPLSPLAQRLQRFLHCSAKNSQ